MYSFKLAADPSGTPGPTSSLHNTRGRKLERRRAQGEAACAECRRLRLKCDRKLPCSSCTHRGCPSICPNGITSGSSRFIPASAEQLQGKLLQMSERIRQLEDALEVAQAVISIIPHPLLSKELLAVKNIMDIPKEAEGKKPNFNVDAETDVFSEFGTLSISDQGEAQVYGRFGAPTYLINTTEDSVHTEKKTTLSQLPTEIVYLSETFPFSPVYIPKDDIQQIIESYLPSYERATALVEIYLQHISPHFQPVDREQIMEELIPMFYRKQRRPENENESETVAHRLALLIAVFACGAMCDLTQEVGNEECDLYSQLSRTALSLQSIFEGTSLATVQTVALLGLYGFFSCNVDALDSAFKMHMLSNSLASNIGLHWDPSNWGIHPKYVNRRRRLLWELCKLDSWKSLSTGRPSTFRMQEISCRFPEVRCAGSIPYEFIKEIVAPAAAMLCSVNAMKYSEIIDWDRRIREFIPHFANETTSERSYGASTSETFLFYLYKETALLYLHRNFFVRAVRENSIYPLQSRFAPSFLAAFTSAVAVLNIMHRECDGENSALISQWPMWINVVSSGLLVGSVAAHNSPKELALSACTELDHAINLFEKAPAHPVLRNGLYILGRLRDRSRTLSKESSAVDAQDDCVKMEEIEKVLSVIGGENRVVKRTAIRKENLARTEHSSWTAEYLSTSSSSARPLLQQYHTTLHGSNTENRPGSITYSYNPPSLLDTERAEPQGRSYFTDAEMHYAPPPHEHQNEGNEVISFQTLDVPTPLHKNIFASRSGIVDSTSIFEQGEPKAPREQVQSPGTVGWNMGPLSWPPMEWNNLNIPANFDFDIDPSFEPLVGEGQNMVLDAWNFMLEGSHLINDDDAFNNDMEPTLHS